MKLDITNHGETTDDLSIPYGKLPASPVEDFSSASTPFASATSSPDRAASAGGYYFSCPASPVHYILSSPPYSLSFGSAPVAGDEASASGSFEFDGAAPGGTMISADELFLNGQIRPSKLPSHLLRPHPLAPTLDIEEGDDDDEAEAEVTRHAAVEEGGRGRGLQIRCRSVHRKTRSMSPLRSPRFQWQGEDDNKQEADKELEIEFDQDLKEAVTPSDSASSSAAIKNSRRWIFLKDLLYRSKSEGSGRGNGKEKERFWHSISFSTSSKSKPPLPPPVVSPPPASIAAVSNSYSSPAAEENKTKSSKRPANGLGRRRAAPRATPSAHERLYTTNRVQAEEMRRRTFLPYRQGLLGCLGFTSGGYNAFNGFAKSLNSVTSRLGLDEDELSGGLSSHTEEVVEPDFKVNIGSTHEIERHLPREQRELCEHRVDVEASSSAYFSDADAGDADVRARQFQHRNRTRFRQEIFGRKPWFTTKRTAVASV